MPASQYRSHSVVLDNAVHSPWWFLSMGSWRLHSMQQGSGRIPMRGRCVPKQSCQTHNRKSATAFLLGQSGIWLFLTSMVFGITLSLLHVCIHFGTPILNRMVEYFSDVYQNVKINIDKTIIRPASFYGCETDTEYSTTKDNVQCQKPGLCCLKRNFVTWLYRSDQIE